jgi:hypothetical protein
MPQLAPQSLAPIDAGQESKRMGKKMGMTEQQHIAALEREEITNRLAKFKATQEKFRREREAYFETTLENARVSGVPYSPFLS